jgi:hypothetical protein
MIVVGQRGTAMPFVLPEQYWLGHNLAFAIHDLIADHLVVGERTGVECFRHAIRSERHEQEMIGLEGEALWDWHVANGYGDVVDEFSYRQLIVYLTADFCHFIYEGLRCSEKGKLTVAFSNFRKPLQDNLFLLEWLLADRQSFLTKFRTSPGHFDLRRLGTDAKKVQRTEIIAKAMDQTPWERWTEPEWMYELRYEKDSEIGFDPFFNRSLHLVTTVKHYATAQNDINLIFCRGEDLDELWKHLYTLVPVVLMHALQVVRYLFESIAPKQGTHDATTDLWIMTGFMLWAESLGDATDQGFAKNAMKEILAEISCPACNAAIQFESSDLQLMWNNGSMICRSCQIPIRLVTVGKFAVPPPEGDS